MKPNKEGKISLILLELENHKTYTETFNTINLKCGTSESSFKRYWATANERYRESQQRRQGELDALLTQAEKDRLLQGIISKDETLKLLSEIAKGEGSRSSGDKTLSPSFNESISAMKTIADIQGWNAPTKAEIFAGSNIVRIGGKEISAE